MHRRTSGVFVSAATALVVLLQVTGCRGDDGGNGGDSDAPSDPSSPGVAVTSTAGGGLPVPGVVPPPQSSMSVTEGVCGIPGGTCTTTEPPPEVSSERDSEAPSETGG